MAKTAMLPDRWEQVIALIERNGGATVEDLVKAVNVSEATVRRDLALIERRGLITRTRGGAVPLEHLPIGPTLAESLAMNLPEKERIGREAAKLIEDGDTIILDGGATTCQVARFLSAQNVSVITNSIDVIQALIPKPGVRIIIIGGELNRSTGTSVGPQADVQLGQLRAAKAILGANALSVEAGLCSPEPLTAQTKRTMAACARELIVVADHTKLCKYATYKAMPLESISILVTDAAADPDVIDAYQRAGTRVIVAPTNESVTP